MPSETGINEVRVPFIYVSQIGGMVGGFSAVAQSKYIGHAGMVQVSKEETNGVLHMLRQGHLDTSAFFNDLSMRSEEFAPQMNSPEEAEDDLELSEYYAPEIIICLSLPKQKIAFCSSYGEEENIGPVSDFIKKVDEMTFESELSPAKPGLYVRAQRIHDPELHFIKPDITLPNLSSTRIDRLRKAIKNEMALIRVAEITDTMVQVGSIELRPDRPVYIQIGKDVFLLTSFKYDG